MALTPDPKTTLRKLRNARYASALAIAMVLSASPWLLKRGCSFHADFGTPVNARTNTPPPVVTNTP